MKNVKFVFAGGEFDAQMTDLQIADIMATWMVGGYINVESETGYARINSSTISAVIVSGN